MPGITMSVNSRFDSAAALLVGNVDQAGDLAKQHVLVGIEDAIGVGYVPQHFDDFNPLLGA